MHYLLSHSQLGDILCNVLWYAESIHVLTQVLYSFAAGTFSRLFLLYFLKASYFGGHSN